MKPPKTIRATEMLLRPSTATDDVPTRFMRANRRISMASEAELAATATKMKKLRGKGFMARTPSQKQTKRSLYRQMGKAKPEVYR